MERIVKFLRENPLQYFATVGRDGKPKVRPFQMMYRDGGRLIYCTGARKEVFAELAVNPCVEICASTMSAWLRICGRVEWIDSREAKEKILSLSPLVKSIYKSADNPDLRVFYLAEAEATITDFSGNPPVAVKLC